MENGRWREERKWRRAYKKVGKRREKEDEERRKDEEDIGFKIYVCVGYSSSASIVSSGKVRDGVPVPEQKGNEGRAGKI